MKKSKKSIFWPIFYLYLTEGWGRNFDQIWLSSLPWSEGLAWQCLGSSIFQPWPQWVTGSFGTINGGAQQVTGYLRTLSWKIRSPKRKNLAFQADFRQVLSKKWIFPVFLQKFNATSSELWKHLIMIPKLILYTWKHISDLYGSYEVKLEKSKKSIFWSIF